MGVVFARIKVMPQGTGVNLDELQERLGTRTPRGARVERFQVEPIAFGLKAIIATVVMGDGEGGTQPVEDAWSKEAGVQSVQVIEVSRGLE
ncbi:MAG: elongation factor 1-beta [Euryarchaeota archaeon]|nr:elongation factor 1-beta [Euryarchaeota archaeon]